MMIHVVDTNSAEHTHVVFNASMIQVLMRAYPVLPIAFYAGGPHQIQVTKYLSTQEKKRLQLIPTEEKKPGSGKLRKAFKVIANLIFDGLLFWRIFSRTKGTESDKIIVLKAHPTSILLIKTLKRIYTRVEAMVVIHGEIEFIYFTNNAWEREMAYLYKRIIRTPAPNFRYILLNKISKSKLVLDQHLKSHEIIEINHPYPYSKTIPTKISQAPLPITVAHVGGLSIRKNAHQVYSLAELLAGPIAAGQLRFVSIGSIDEDAAPYRNTLVSDFTHGKKGGYISRQIFVEEIRKIDYAVFFYRPNQYIFRASGSIMDVIDFTKPIIALRHPFFDYLTSQVGNIGFLCADLGEMAEILSRIGKRDTEVISKYDEQSANLDKFKQMYGTEFIANDFKEQVSN